MRDALRSRPGTVALGILVVVAAALGRPEGGYGEHSGVNHSKPAVDAAIGAYTPEPLGMAALSVGGSDTMRPLLTRLAAKFNRWHPQVRVAVQGTRNPGEEEALPVLQLLLDGLAGSRRGDIREVGHEGANQIRILAVSRELTRDELLEFVERHGYRPVSIPIAQDAIAVYVHRDNPIKGLTLAQVDAIFSKTRKRGAPEDVTRWGQVGLDGAWADAPIHLYGRNRNSTGTRPFFTEHVLLDGEFKDELNEEPGSASVALAVARDPHGIGFSGIGFQIPAIRAVPLADKSGMPSFEPSRDSVMSRVYPLARRLYLYVNKEPDKPLSPAVREFLKFINSQDGQDAVVQAGLFPLDAVQVARNLQILTGSKATAGVPGRTLAN